MIKKVYNLKIVTPCFSGGANPKNSELRVPSIRGMIRWWFRILGGTMKEEEEVFGGSLNDLVKKSEVIFRIKNVKKGDDNSLSETNTFFTRQKTSISAETLFDLELIFDEKRLRNDLVIKLEKAIKVFINFGSMGSRSNHGLGAISENKTSTRNDLEMLLKSISTVKFFISRDSFKTQKNVIEKQKGFENQSLEFVTQSIRKSFNSDNQRADFFGGIKPRQSSALKFRPIKIDDKFYGLIYLAPTILGQDIKYDLSQISKKITDLGYTILN